MSNKQTYIADFLEIKKTLKGFAVFMGERQCAQDFGTEKEAAENCNKNAGFEVFKMKESN